ncbi:MAG: cofactor-independent phosphoglycerate mutase [Planctomycetota bacterium]|jgi:2,3-bisphosphoglycerate-independent phosphoglycerate mutase
MKYVVIIPDGAADRPIAELGGKTPLEAAEMPALARLAAEGLMFSANTVPEGFSPGSDVANLSVLGFNPAEYYTGRAPLEAASIGIKLKPDESVYRANTVTVIDDIMKDYSGGHISTEDAAEIITYLNDNLAVPGVELYVGTQYRHACVISDSAGKISKATPPHDILEQKASMYPPSLGISEKLTEIMEKTKELMIHFPGNDKREKEGKARISQLWLWGGGVMPELPKFCDRYGVSGGLISAVDLLKGIAALSELSVIEVEGATGFYDTNYAGKGDAALSFLEENDFVAVHVEAPDEAGHNADVAEKVKALENIDRYIIGPISAAAENQDMRILVMPDHPTPIELRTHTSDPVPACIWGSGIKCSSVNDFTEKAVRKAEHVKAHTLIDRMINS